MPWEGSSSSASSFAGQLNTQAGSGAKGRHMQNVLEGQAKHNMLSLSSAAFVQVLCSSPAQLRVACRFACRGQ